jgi:hypothetical protein
MIFPQLSLNPRIDECHVTRELAGTGIPGTVAHDPMGHPEMMKMPLFKAASHFLL